MIKPPTMSPVIAKRSAIAPSQIALNEVSARIERRLAEYLRSWGLNDDEIIAAHARRWTRHVLHEAADGAVPLRVAYLELEQRALARAMSAVYLWIARLTRLLERDGEEVSKGLPAMRIRKLLATEPHAFLRIKELSPSFMSGLRGAARAVVPHAESRTMPEQPLGELVPLLTTSPYRSLVLNLAAWCFGRRRSAWGSNS
ncbi:MAG: hypothetical protein C0483_18035 [Pirellula sp.]|nr:hypothetical protein [Pirellula sp.]